jgi:hypothetical protein
VQDCVNDLAQLRQSAQDLLPRLRSPPNIQEDLQILPSLRYVHLGLCRSVLPTGEASHGVELGDVRLELGRRTGDEVCPCGEGDACLLFDVLAGNALHRPYGPHDGQAGHAESAPLLPLPRRRALRDHVERVAQGLERLRDGPAVRADGVDCAIQRGKGRPDGLD